MTDKMTCPGCNSHTSSVLAAYEDGHSCPVCGLTADATEEILRDPLGAVYDWLVADIGVDSLISKPPWLDTRTLAEHWRAHEARYAAEHADAEARMIRASGMETVDDYVALILAETGWDE